MRQSEAIARCENYLWSNLKLYLQSYQTCLLDLILQVKDKSATEPINRYKDFFNQLEQHVGLGSYVNGQAAQFSKTPYVTVNIAAVPMGDCTIRAIMGFDIVYSTDTPKANDDTTRYVGSSSESVALFRNDMVDALNQLFFHAYGNEEPAEWDTQAFYDMFYKKEVSNPVKTEETKAWQFNVFGQVDDEITISEVTQLKREDRSVGLNLFHVVYEIDIDELSNDSWTSRC